MKTKKQLVFLEDLDMPDEDEERTRARRLFTYSTRAIAQAAKVDQMFINHPQIKSALEGLDRVFQLSREMTSAQGVAVIGSTGCGKTSLIKHFCASLPRSDLFEVGLGALAVRLPKSPNVGQVVGALLKQLKYPFPQVNATTLSIKRTVLIEALQQKGTRLIFIDEAHHLRSQARMRNRYEDGTSVTDLLRELMDEVPLALALCGGSGLEDLASLDRHLDSRISARFELKSFENSSSWHGFVRAFKKYCIGFDLSFLDSREEAERLHRGTGGNLRAFKRLVTEAVLVAVDLGAAHLEAGHLHLAFSRVHGGGGAMANPYAK